jgi:hypothetical protein
MVREKLSIIRKRCGKAVDFQQDLAEKAVDFNRDSAEKVVYFYETVRKKRPSFIPKLLKSLSKIGFRKNEKLSLSRCIHYAPGNNFTYETEVFFETKFSGGAMLKFICIQCLHMCTQVHT